MRTIRFSTISLLAGVSTLAAQASPDSSSMKLQRGPAPAVFPAGAKMAVVKGDPSKAAPFTVELAMPDGYRIPPHFHPTDETVEVRKGLFMYGMGDTLDVAKTKTMKVGDKGTLPARAHHFAVAQGETVVDVSAMGPFAMTYVNPSDNPQAAPARP